MEGGWAELPVAEAGSDDFQSERFWSLTVHCRNSSVDRLWTRQGIKDESDLAGTLDLYQAEIEFFANAGGGNTGEIS